MSEARGYDGSINVTIFTTEVIILFDLWMPDCGSDMAQGLGMGGEKGVGEG